MDETEGEGRVAATWLASVTFLMLIAAGIAALSPSALSQVKGGGAMGPPAMGPIGPVGPAMAPQAPAFVPSTPIFVPGAGVSQSIPSETGARKGNTSADLIDKGGNGGNGGLLFGNGGNGGADPNESRRASAKSNLKQLGLAFQVAPTADGPWPVPGVSGQFSGGGNLRLLSSNADGVLKLGITGPGTYSMTLSTQQLAKAVTAVGNTGASPQPIIAVLVSLLLPAVQKPGVVIEKYITFLNGYDGVTSVQHVFTDVPAKASAHRDLTITVTIPEGDGSPKIDWGDGTPAEISGTVIPATGDMQFDGHGEARVAVIPLPTVEQQSHENGGGVAFQDGHAKFASERGVNSPSGSSAGPAKLTAILFPVFAQAKLGVSSTGDGTVRELTTNDQGAVLLGKLPAGTLDLNVSGENLKAWLNTAVGPTNPPPQETLIELLVVIAIIAMKTDGEPVILARALPATSLPKNLPLKLSVDSNGAPTGTWWDGAPLAALFGRGGNGGNGGNGITDSSSGAIMPVARKETTSHSNDDANRLKIQLTNLLISSLKAGEVAIAVTALTSAD